ncbi:M6 family metalloprotease domain protein [Limihaloglobus sulfuriphilus]|uniref:Probable pectate lyase C n=1 Tax=Limihaloglobus sulfuriphilus TaxID=1851148 RepID=A0A1Q2MBP6_9BACT|nr:hypothetical protein [Limihaloglobus sulfuriphilus]AQQ70126.1 M6 family metalloprotease domain protein [Limihaloglobus sulfuriphilus]
MKKQLFVLLLLLCSLPAFGRLFDNRPVQLVQPDGTAIKAFISGDQFYMDIRLADGTSIVKDPQSGFYCYGVIADDGSRIVSTGVPAGYWGMKSSSAGSKALLSKEARDSIRNEAIEALFDDSDTTQSSMLKTAEPAEEGYFYDALGVKTGLVLLVYFQDDIDGNPDLPEYSGYAPNAVEVADFCNLQGYEGLDMNGSVRDYFSDVSLGNLDLNFTVSGYYMSQNEQAYYETYSEDNPEAGKDGADVLFEEIIASASVTPSDYDTVILVYAGSTGNLSDILPKTDFSPQEGVYYTLLDTDYTFGLGNFAYSTALTGLGWRQSVGGEYCLMDDGAYFYNPVKPNAGMRVLSGWIIPEELTDSDLDTTVTCEPDQIYIVKRYDDQGQPYEPQEYFLLENRSSQEGSRDERIPGSGGLTIWRVRNNNISMITPYYYYEPNPWYNRDWTPTTIPGTEWSDYTISHLAFTNISSPGIVMSFNFGQEFPPPSTGNIYIMQTDGTVGQTAYAEIQSAVNAAQPGEEILLERGGTFYGNHVIVNKNITIRSYDETEPDAIFPEETIVEGYYNKPVFDLRDSDNVTLRGLTITNGNSVLGGLMPSMGEHGGGIYCLGGEANIADCIIHSNYAYRSGGGIYLNSCLASIERCRIFNNTAEIASGGGVFSIWEGNPNQHRRDNLSTVKNCEIFANTANWGGGISSVYESWLEVVFTTIAYNNAVTEGGGVDCQDGSAMLMNSIIWGNMVNGDMNSWQLSMRNLSSFSAVYLHYSCMQKNQVNIGTEEEPVYEYSFAHPWDTEVSYRSVLSTDPQFALPVVELEYKGLLETLQEAVDNGTELEIEIARQAILDYLALRDFHLKSAQGRWTGAGFENDGVTSPCINAGNTSPYEPNEDNPYSDFYALEPEPNGEVVNLGRYGGTEQASRSTLTIDLGYYEYLAADYNQSGVVDIDDYDVFNGLYANYPGEFDPETDYNSDGEVNVDDWIHFQMFDLKADNLIENIDLKSFLHLYNGYIETFDIDGSGDIGNGDYAVFAADYSGDYNERSDFNGDGKIDFTDLSMFTQIWLFYQL